eukprot:CAMPEP_0113540140 /NCGR_PEP_ID=MMETSP0015_2-20120614/8316_1 /TAXON_ID=2838 /ORGANISM="Odontella" /LENGTH=605 /DNA_ID=CAMNT_0000439913 /DNA_START=145 /DNA_END=1962 /DNA_ORIENTATION=+ /assembly_acc=CAM_ASM_000160
MPLIPSLRKSAVIAAALLAVSSSSSVDAAATTKKRSLAKMQAKAEFMRAMNGVAAATTGAGKSRRRGAAGANLLRKKLAAVARPMPASMKAEFEAPSSSSSVPAFMSKGALSGIPAPRRRLDEEEDQYGFDVTQYSFKYAGCSAVATYSDDMADDEDYGSVVVTKKYVVFRLCPTAYCSDDYPYGCGGGYGEYIVDMADYLDVMAQFQENSMERYCDYCEQCMEEAEEEAEEEEEQEEEGEEEEDQDQDEEEGEEEEENQDEEEGEEEQNDEEDNGEDRKRRRLDDGEDQDEEEQQEEDDEDAEEDAEEQEDAAAAQGCADYDACYNYANVCGDEDNGDDEEEQVDYMEYFECQEVDNNNGNGQQYFVGPHCSYDKKTISIGLYADEYCSEYVGGDDVNMANVLGFDIDDDALANYYDEDCVTCNAKNLPYQDDEEEDGDGDGDGDDDEEAEVTELCDDLFDAAGKCHLYMNDVEEDAYGENQAENEGSVCGFIQNVVTGQYDEYGYIYLSADDYNKDNRNNQYAHTNGSVSIGQIFGIIVSVLACIILTVWACFLHRKLTRRAPWRPRRAGGSGAKAGKLSRNNSGILMGRSRSGGSYHGGQMS